MTGKDQPSDFELDIDFGDEFEDDEPDGLEQPEPSVAPPSVPSRPTPRGIGPPPKVPPPPRHRTGHRYRGAAPQPHPVRRPTRIPGVPLTDAEAGPSMSVDIEPEDLTNIFASGDPLAHGTEVEAAEIPETSLDEGFDPWSDLSDDEGELAAFEAGDPELSARFADDLTTPVVGVRDQLAAEAAVPEFDVLADLGFSARPVTLEQLHVSDPSYVEGSEIPGTDDYVSFDDLRVGDDSVPPGMTPPPADVGLKQMTSGSAEVETSPLVPGGEASALDEFSIDVDEGAFEHAAPANDGDSTRPGHDSYDGALIDQGAHTRELDPVELAAQSVLNLENVKDLGDSELDFESAGDSREIQRAALEEVAFDADEEDDDLDDDSMFGDDDDAVFGDDDDIGDIDLHVPEWSPLVNDAPTATLNPVATGYDTKIEHARHLLNEGRAGDACALLTQVLQGDPVHPEALTLRATAQEALEDMAFVALGDLDGYPRLRIHPNDIVKLDIDSKGAFLLMQIDGELTTADLLELSPMGRGPTAALLAQFVADEVIVILEPEPWDPRRPR